MDEDDATTIRKRDALGRVTLPKAQREALLDEFERSSLPGTQFARAAGVNYQTFACWVQQRRHARGDYESRPKARSSALRLVEAVVASPVGGGATQARVGQSDGSARLELLLPGGVRVFITDASQVALAAQLLKALGASC